MERILLALAALVAVVLQTTLIPHLAVFSFAPDLIFLLVLFLALHRQTTLGLWMAFGAGLFQDIASGGFPGLNSLLLLALVYLALYLRQKFFQENLISQVLIIVFFTWLHQFLTYFVMNALLHTGFLFSSWLARAAGMSVYHACLGPLVFRFFRTMLRREEAGRPAMKGQGGGSGISFLEAPPRK